MKLSINMAMTLDGKVVRPDGRWYGLTSSEDKTQMDVYRSQSDAVLVGKNSIINDNPIVKIRAVPNALNPRPVILVRKGTLPPDKHVFEESDHIPLIICTKTNLKEIKTSLENKAEIFALDSDDIDPKKVTGILKRKGYKNVLLEGGPKLNFSFLEADLVDRIYLTIVPYIIGKNGLAGIADRNMELPGFDKNGWTLKDNFTKGNEIFLVYEKG
ncbi:RibD family protein [Leptospira kanakyensis]|uniref:RibD family protein n=1 Tax=Leptospira kanakyensis TaxID=2484968 RepID=A0A6N4Q7P8_9LEPT|nr:RibD family protein [Leptospira kanakyensis]MCW7469807.1 RibD family protein [Leptospira kanakyensis]MCW7480788.1 RibD family protein [Leptospira kanakyensis]TGK47595.1 RibD family protein [Leptospira kanakyensis]TGK63401.1 RibD family protein [Leptospira kanakyensis]TGK67005.1 RibD family protein [Leptospira kanakyensis]